MSSFGKFIEATGKLVGNAIDAASDKLDELSDNLESHSQPPAGAPAPAPIVSPRDVNVGAMGAPAGWQPIERASESARELAKASTGGSLRFAMDISSPKTRYYAFWFETGRVVAFYEVPPLR